MSQFNYGDIITNFRDKSKEESQSTIEWIENEIRTWKVIDVKDNFLYPFTCILSVFSGFQGTLISVWFSTMDKFLEN